MLRISMLLSCIVMTNRTTLADDPVILQGDSTTPTLSPSLPAHTSITTSITTTTTSSIHTSRSTGYAVTCYICVNVSDNRVCNQYAIDRPCRPGETFCHTLHIVDSKGTSVLVNKKCTTAKECERNMVGCVEIDTQLMCVSCCDHDYCNVSVPTNASSAVYDDKVTRMRAHVNEHFHNEREKALTTSLRDGAHVDVASAIVWMAAASALLRRQ